MASEECVYCELDAWYTCAGCGDPICHEHSVHSDGSTWCTECESDSISNRITAETLADIEALDDREEVMRSGR